MLVNAYNDGSNTDEQWVFIASLSRDMFRTEEYT